MSMKRKRNQSVGITEEPNTEPDLKKGKREVIDKKNELHVSSKEQQNQVKLEGEPKQEGKETEIEEKATNEEGSIKKSSTDENNNEKVDTKRKRKEKNKRLAKADDGVTLGGSRAKKIFKNQDIEAHIQVEDWRLNKIQSPIELKHDDTVEHDHFEPLEFHGHWDEAGEATFTNNGHTATLRFQNRELPILKGGPLHEDEYIFEQLHFHWSEDDHSGCEHIFEGQAYSMEAHAVHYNSKYQNFKEAHDKLDGLAVVAFFLQATDNDDHPCFNKLSDATRDIIKVNTTTNVRSDCLTWFKEEAQCKGYYTYQGSLTTEPYTESVTWILYPQPIHVAREQVANFRKLNSTPCEKYNITQNVRPLQTPPEHKKLNILYARSHKPEYVNVILNCKCEKNPACYMKVFTVLKNTVNFHNVLYFYQNLKMVIEVYTNTILYYKLLK
ncbi:hypothetical protein NQ317_005515 [Molorchus minor]|uniref:Alpha-carbonic anhydrase domain-containing protein n=1 Tax=Molorchus minor TaxID=1323400 RepID=A0ABQ9IX96_9CUCU|nr:hypothetical protein NQ317_005515 [Molorchus minor]